MDSDGRDKLHDDEHDEELPEGVFRSPHEGSEGEHYFYWQTDVLIVEDDLELIDEKLKVEENGPGGRIGKPARRREGSDLGVLYLQTKSPEDVPGLVKYLREPVKRNGVFRYPRVQPELVLLPHYHGPYDPLGPPKSTQNPLGDLPRKGFFPLPGHGVTVAVVDTGVWKDSRPWFDRRSESRVPQDQDVLDLDGDGKLNRADGHGTFIAGVILRHAPGACVKAFRCQTTPELSKAGMVRDMDLAKTILEAAADPKVTIINISAGGPSVECGGLPQTMAAVDRVLNKRPEIAIVASAGNHNTAAPFFPAAMKGVISVGAVERRDGHDVRANFSNFGPSVDAAAPGTDVHSIHVEFPGFSGWAKWSGTSFSAPTVAAAAAVRKAPGGWKQYLLWFLLPKTARQAAYEVITDPSYPRVPGIGTIVRPQSYVD